MKKLPSIVAILMMFGLFIPGCVSKPIDCSQVDVFCVGMVTNVGRRDDRSYNQAVWEGILLAKANGAADMVEFIETVNSRDYEENISVFAEANYDAIVTVGSAMREATKVMAGVYPNIYFIGLDQEQLPNQEHDPNLVGLVFAEDQIGYLAGALAAMLSKTGQIGAVCASDELAFMNRYGRGFLAGAAYINPEVKATVIYHNEVGLDKTFVDPEWGAKKAISLVDSGADIIFGVGGTTGNNAIVTAATRDAYGIGADTDLFYTFPVTAPHLYVSVVKLIAPGIAELIRAARSAQAGTSAFQPGDYLGQVGLSPYHYLDSVIPDSVKSRMTELNQALISGDIQTGISINNP